MHDLCQILETVRQQTYTSAIRQSRAACAIKLLRERPYLLFAGSGHTLQQGANVSIIIPV